ncbi:hypothetical protein LEP1GSC175_1434 [Leptospira santarosai str. HAI821]|nr:hypothetical protein LEP1GSC175_1434 [Leptospira santarosai str. HAI821]
MLIRKDLFRPKKMIRRFWIELINDFVVAEIRLLAFAFSRMSRIRYIRKQIGFGLLLF